MPLHLRLDCMHLSRVPAKSSSICTKRSCCKLLFGHMSADPPSSEHVALARAQHLREVQSLQQWLRVSQIMQSSMLELVHFESSTPAGMMHAGSHDWRAGRLPNPGSASTAGADSFPPAVHASLAVLEVQVQLPQVSSTHSCTYVPMLRPCHRFLSLKQDPC